MDHDNLALKLFQDAKVFWPDLKKTLLARRGTLGAFFLGLTIAIGSTGLLMGALTTALASYMMSQGMEMVPAMNVGFFSVGTVSLICGLALLFGTARKLTQSFAKS